MKKMLKNQFFKHFFAFLQGILSVFLFLINFSSFYNLKLIIFYEYFLFYFRLIFSLLICV